jgi:hypothetical protein
MGTYSGPLTRGDNGCNVTDWAPGGQVDDVTFDIVQSGTSVTITTNGSEAAVEDAVVMGHTFSGDVTDSSLNALIVGTMMRTLNTCHFRLDAAMTATVSGTMLSGEIHYRETVLDPSCIYVTDAGIIEQNPTGCDSASTFSDSR